MALARHHIVAKEHTPSGPKTGKIGAGESVSVTLVGAGGAGFKSSTTPTSNTGGGGGSVLIFTLTNKVTEANLLPTYMLTTGRPGLVSGNINGGASTLMVTYPSVGFPFTFTAPGGEGNTGVGPAPGGALVTPAIPPIFASIHVTVATAGATSGQPLHILNIINTKAGTPPLLGGGAGYSANGGSEGEHAGIGAGGAGGPTPENGGSGLAALVKMG